MRVAAYARVSTTRQAQAQGIEQQLDRLRAAAAERGWDLEDQHVYRDDGYSGARIGLPGLDRLRDHAALAELDVVLVTAPDRLARNYVHQVLLIDELAGRGCQVEFLDRPMSADPHDQLLLQIRGAVAEYENYAELGIVLVLGEDALELDQQLVLRGVAARPLDELHPDPGPGELLQQQRLVGELAGQPVRE